MPQDNLQWHRRFRIHRENPVGSCIVWGLLRDAWRCHSNRFVNRQPILEASGASVAIQKKRLLSNEASGSACPVSWNTAKAVILDVRSLSSSLACPARGERIRVSDEPFGPSVHFLWNMNDPIDS